MSDGVEKTPGEQAEALKQEGNVKFKANDYAGAIELYSRSIELDPSQHTVFSNRSASHIKLKNHEEALADAQMCVKLSPSWVKGYNRVAAAFQGLKEWDKAIEICREGLEKSSGEELEKMISEVKRNRLRHELLGPWHGKVDPALGGYDQEMEFMEDGSVKIIVLGQDTVGKYWVDADKEPHHLSIQVQPPGMPPGPMPPVPPVPYICRTDEEGLHICCPYMKMERPTEFSGPGYCIMKRGLLEASATTSELDGLSRIEKLKLCAKEFTAMLPDTKIDNRDPNTLSEVEANESMLQQVRLQSQMYELQKRFGEKCMNEVMEASKDHGSLDVRKMEEMKPLIAKLKTCGLLEEDPPPTRPPTSSLASSGPAPPAEVKRAEPENKVPDAKKLDAAFDRTTVVVSLLAVAAVAASAAFVLWKKQRR